MEQYYFAYGSNINLQQMALRCPNARVVGPCVPENYELLFRGNGGGFGVATIAAKEGSRVHGLLWKITDHCEKSLDIYEGYPHLYKKAPVTVKNSKGKQISVMAYIMNDERNLAPVPPSNSYYDSIDAGFKQNGLPETSLREALKKVWQEYEVFSQHKKRQQERYTQSR